MCIQAAGEQEARRRRWLLFMKKLCAACSPPPRQRRFSSLSTPPHPCLRTLAPCSVHARENEGVVAAVLEEAAQRGFRLEAPFPGWPRRGVEGLVAGAERLVRVDADEDGTDGFFVAVFAKKEGEAVEEEEQQQQQQQGGSKRTQQRRKR